MFSPQYSVALSRLNAFLPNAGYAYATKRNYDDIAHVSALSPYIRHRIIAEEDVLRAVLANHSLKAAEKFIQEVYWRTYWKGWLEMRPSVWTHYQGEVQKALNRVQTETGLRANWEAACKGETGIDCFDHWAAELMQTGYLHNHARMWFASIWIFTLRLPWALGADFFLRHLLDGDPASNTLSWRWVGGLQTVGKTYLARSDNIEKYTNGRFHPQGLATSAPALDGAPPPGREPIPISDPISADDATVLLITEEDMSPGWLLQQFTPARTVVVQTTAARSPLDVSPQVSEFVAAGLRDCIARYEGRLGPVSQVAAADLGEWCGDNGVTQLVTAYIPTGPTKDMLRDVPLAQQLRPFDAAAWPHATHGFFRFKEKIPELLSNLRGLHVA